MAISMIRQVSSLSCSTISGRFAIIIIVVVVVIIVISEFLTSQLWLGNIHLSWDVVINKGS